MLSRGLTGIDSLKNKSTFDDEWIIKHAHMTKESYHMQFGHDKDLPLVWPEWVRYYEDIVTLRNKLECKKS